MVIAPSQTQSAVTGFTYAIENEMFTHEWYEQRTICLRKPSIGVQSRAELRSWGPFMSPRALSPLSKAPLVLAETALTSLSSAI